jgi:hypothetical protein
MKNITIACDRCGRVIQGTIDKCPHTGAIITEGYYDVAGLNWHEFARWEEEFICDDCMHSDPKYKELYSLT